MKRERHPYAREPQTVRGHDMTMMSHGTSFGRRRRSLRSAALAGVFGLVLCGPALAQTAGPSDSLTVNLMRLLVKQGVITQSAADQLVAQAQRETAEARAGDAPIASNLPPAAPGATRVPYVPQIVRDQIRDEVRTEVIQQAKLENWAQPNQIPEWTKRISISGDLRFRDEYDLYSKGRDVLVNGKLSQVGNDPDLINFAAFNANGPTDINPNTNPAGLPYLDTRENRDNQLAIRARLDILATPSPWVSADIRLASGSTNSPVSTTQYLGGGLTKKNIWLDRAFIDIHPAPWISGTLGRMPNPFYSTDLVYDDDLNFDGASARGTYDIWPSQGVSLTGIGGAFLLGYQDYNDPTDSDQKAGTRVKWMFAAQGSADWNTPRFDWRVAAAYYQFQYDRGLLSQPCALYTGLTQCSTDFTAPAFMQKGNTLFLIRDIVTNPAASSGNTPEPELAGLTFDYNVLDLTTSFDLKLAHQKHLVLVGDFARNLAYKHSDACRYGEAGLPLTNVISSSPTAADGTVTTNTDPCIAGSTAKFQSGPNAWMLRATYGDPNPFSLGQWSFTAGYKHIDPDAVVDAYNDSDFHYGGTNAKGYFLLATFGLLDGSNLQARWFSADQVYGAPLSIDVGQIDINARF
jgi:hypothetical protein